MAYINLEIYSESLGMQTPVTVFIPQKATKAETGINDKTEKEKYKCLYLLHGLSDDNTIWARRTSIERYAIEYNICVVMPCALRSFYTDMKYGQKFYTYVAKELPDIIEDMFNVSTDRKDRFIGGNSMGGYGAIKIALREKERYSAVFGLSSVADVTKPRFEEVLKLAFGDNVPDDENLFTLAKAHNQDKVKPRIYMTIGKQDYMYQDNLELRDAFNKLDYDFTFVETEGGHNWTLWDFTVQEALKWIFKDEK